MIAAANASLLSKWLFKANGYEPVFKDWDAMLQ